MVKPSRFLLGLLPLTAALLCGCPRPHSARPPGADLAQPAEASAAAAPRFENVAAAAGLDFRWGHGGKTPLTNVETFGCGCAFLDANDDGWLDILLVGEPACGLFLNRKDGTFRDVSVQSGLAAVKGPWKGCAVGDYDNDGNLDLLLTGYKDIRLLRGCAVTTF